ncbi:MAG: NAD(P)-dependent oxidoreductase [Alphaproteobacteria bacterium]|nr:NAD(P)-dependent oxidoreductase [Alphaproteobacteria bacterium]
MTTIKELRRVGMVGLGDQSQPMARLYIQQGWPFAFFARRPEVIEEFTGLGGNFTPTMRELGAASDIALIIVNTNDEVGDVVFH